MKHIKLFENFINESVEDKLIKLFTDQTGIKTWDKVKLEGEKGTWTVVRLWSSAASGGMNDGLSIELTQGSSREHFKAMEDNGELTSFGKNIKKK